MLMNLGSQLHLLDEILEALIATESVITKDDFHRLKNSILAKYRTKDTPTAIELIARYNE